MRKVFDAADVRAMKFEDFVDVAKLRVVAKADLEKPAATSLLTDPMRKAAAGMAADDLLVHATTKAPKLGEHEVLPKDAAIVVRRDGEQWKLLHVVR
jgi:hypothetical protein